ncbi:MAG: Holliday junction branch migration protein RuvA [Cyanobacteria bacterium SZAS LIN-5]|nr:Holliday junction branch migration protein RuvA [Cyanobacteria bacterium SZAS LIN-5]
MLAYLHGTIALKEMTTGQADRLVLDVSGVGFELTVSRRTLMMLGLPGDEATVHTALTIRETEWNLFGFATQDERAIFGLLQSVSGIGPKLALALVGTLGPQQLAEAILAGDQKMISQAPGVGAKVAQRIILELKAKIEDWTRQRGLSTDIPDGWSSIAEEVRNILEGLGYTGTEINMALKKAREEKLDEDVESLVRFSLKVLGAASIS